MLSGLLACDTNKKDEPGGDIVETVLAESVISSVNWAEVIQK
jgi:PIN domain nuclease of toxin-antitoxin system